VYVWLPSYVRLPLASYVRVSTVSLLPKSTWPLGGDSISRIDGLLLLRRAVSSDGKAPLRFSSEGAAPQRVVGQCERHCDKPARYTHKIITKPATAN
jgi:hypothetical protein